MLFNPFNQLAIYKIDQNTYLAYTKLEMLSRRARYLISENKGDNSNDAHLTHDRHLAKAIRHLDKLLFYFSNLHNFTTPPKLEITCQDLNKNEDFKHFKVR